MRKLLERSLSFESRNSRPLNLLQETGYFCLWILALVLSMCFSGAELQFLLISLITGARWVAAGNSRNINIFIEERG